MPVNVFGGGAVQTAYVSYLSIDLRAPPLGNVVLVWPNSYVNVPYTANGINYNALAASMTVNTANPNIYTITLPDATMASVGQNFIITNIGAASFNLYKSDGTTLVLTAAVGVSYWVQLTSNTTGVMPDPLGSWSVVTFGAGTSQAQASSLVGLGLTAIGTTLNTNIPVKSIGLPDSPYNVLAADRASLIVWKGGTDTVTLPAINTVPSGFYVSFNNQGTGQMNLTTADMALIDTPPAPPLSSLPLPIFINQSLTVVSDGTQWWTLGLGQNQFSVVNVLNTDVSASVNITLTTAQGNYLIQEFSGTLNHAITIFFPTSPNNWYVSNETFGGFTINVQLTNGSGGGSGTSYPVASGVRAIFYSDGTSIFSIPS